MPYKRPSMSRVNLRLRTAQQVLFDITGLWIDGEDDLLVIQLWYNKSHSRMSPDVELVYLKAIEMYIDSLDIIESRVFQRILDKGAMAELANA